MTWRAPSPTTCHFSRYDAHHHGNKVTHHTSVACSNKEISIFSNLLYNNIALWPSQAFSDYQIQQMTANFVDQFGFNDEEFSEHDENIKYVVEVSHSALPFTDY